MKNQNCYIEFDIPLEKSYEDLYSTFEYIKEAKNTGRPKEDNFWLKTFPDYSLSTFYFSDDEPRPDFKTAELDEVIWHFYSLTNLLQTDYDIEYKDCFKISTGKGRLEYYPFGYPYGGVTGLIVFISSFGCKPTTIDDGTGVYSITFLENGDFSLSEINSPKKHDSSQQPFDAVDLLKKFVNRLKK